MNEVLLTNVFFIITGSAVILCTLFLCVALFHVIKVVRVLRRIFDTIEAGTEVIAEDMQQIRSFFTQDGLIARLITMALGQRRHNTRARTKVSRKQAELEITDN